MPGPGWGIAAGAFGVVAALLLVGGGIALRFQRDRYRFLIMQARLEKGIPPLVNTPPAWLLSLRQGCMALFAGLALMLVGGMVAGAAGKVPMPTAAEMAQPAMLSAEDQPPGPEGDALPVRPVDAPPGGPMHVGPREGGDAHQGRHDRGPVGPDFRPPREAPAVEHWHRAQDHKALAGLSASVGFILVVLGGVRVVFAFAERRYADPAGQLV